MEQASGEVPCSGARQRDKAERSERRKSRRRSRLNVIVRDITSNVLPPSGKHREVQMQASLQKTSARKKTQRVDSATEVPETPQLLLHSLFPYSEKTNASWLKVPHIEEDRKVTRVRKPIGTISRCEEVLIHYLFLQQTTK